MTPAAATQHHLPLAELALIAVALSIDALAVAVAAAASGRTAGSRAVFRLTFHFGLFQALMPILGWAAGALLARSVASFGRWLACGLLTLVAVRMLRAGAGAEETGAAQDPTRGLTLVALSTAVSLDALAVGVSLALLSVEIWLPSVVIGVVTGVVSLLGVGLGARLHLRFGRRAEWLGGVILLLIALRIALART
jgi:manganese efflux pump family protein